MSMRYVEHAFGPEELAKNIAEKRKATVDVGPVMGHGRPNRLPLYGKGPLLLVELENRIGRPAMDRLMIAMAKEPAHTTAIFLRHLTELAGADAARDFDAALHACLQTPMVYRGRLWHCRRSASAHRGGAP